MAEAANVLEGARAFLEPDDNPKRIWLSPACDEERTWCQDDVGPCDDCGRPSIKYIRADLHDALIAALNHANGFLLNAKIDLETGAPKKTAIITIEGGILMVNAALAKAGA